MSTSDPHGHDLSTACWRCQNWGGLVAGVHASCTRVNSLLQADPSTGCVYWTAGTGDAHPAAWLPVGLHLPEKTMIWGKQAPASERPPIPANDKRPGTPSEAVAWDREQERKAWRTADALMARVRRRDSSDHRREYLRPKRSAPNTRSESCT